ncbi:hypothetical protein BDP27DRAFT_1503900 [Rhodocollybia butyracea]|uniref:Uncharacterized protein n=1 Tax=Rhodocollybia butyracea TaxID=206335 RepID=A0A9P5PS57_9AGAR|nr:hypothetical protein BDP27DRAFT_1503900 [Rhodocollybia butyracea]
MLITPHIHCVGFIFAVLISTVHAMPTPAPLPSEPPDTLAPLRNVPPGGALMPILPSIWDVPTPGYIPQGTTLEHISMGPGPRYRVTFLQVNSRNFEVATMDFARYPHHVMAGTFTKRVIGTTISGVLGKTETGNFYTNGECPDGRPTGGICGPWPCIGWRSTAGRGQPAESSIYHKIDTIPDRLPELEPGTRARPAALDLDFWNRFPRVKFLENWVWLKAEIDLR